MNHMQQTLARLREERESKRRAILATIRTPRERGPVCFCGIEMVKHFTKDYFWCPMCKLTEENLNVAKRARWLAARVRVHARKEALK